MQVSRIAADTRGMNGGSEIPGYPHGPGTGSGGESSPCGIPGEAPPSEARLKVPASGRMSSLRQRRRQRLLGADSRTGRFARNEGWGRIGTFVKRWWALIVAFPIICVVAVIPLALMTSGWIRGSVITGAFVSGIWIDVLAAVIWTGAGNQFMGATAEAWTAQELRRLRSSGWLLINGVLRDRWGDIDHVLVGPGGVLVVETKWSAHSWPIANYESGYMSGSLKTAANQAHAARKEVANELSSIAPGVPVISATVLWSSSPSDGVEWNTWRDKHTAIVQGSQFRRWLGECLPRDGVSPKDVQRVWSELAQKVESQDSSRAALGDTPPPTIWGLVLEWAVKPLMGCLAAIYLLSLTRFAHNWIGVAAASVGAVAIGLAGLRPSWTRTAALGWTASSLAWTLALTLLLVRDVVGK